MSKLPATLAALALALGLAVACGSGGGSRPQGADAVESFTQDVRIAVEKIERSHSALSDPALNVLPASERESRYSGLEEEIRLERDRIGSGDIPDELTETRRLVTSVLSKEREIWVHMVLFARTGQEVHSVLATELLLDSQEELERAIIGLQQVRIEVGLDPSIAGLESYTSRSTGLPTATIVVRASEEPKSATPTPTAVPTFTPDAGSPTHTATSPTPTRLQSDTPTQTAIASPTAPHTPTPRPSPTPTTTPTPLPTETLKPTLAPTLTPTATPTSTATPTPTPTATAEVTPQPSPTPTTPPIPILKDGQLVVIRFPDNRGNPALIAHWIVDVEPRELAMVEYPFLLDDRLEISIYINPEKPGTTLDRTYIETPAGERFVTAENFERPWQGEAMTTSNGTYGIFFDNTQGDGHQEMHVLITYHKEAPGSQPPG